MNAKSTYQHWQLVKDPAGIGWLAFDRRDASVNSINAIVLNELKDIVDAISKDSSWTGLAIYSTKKTGFILGAEIALFKEIKDVDQAYKLIRHGQKVFSALEALKIPTVAMIEGLCLGGGLELALACDYRVAEGSHDTKLGLPEVRLGFHPGWGGTVRLTRLVGPIEAIPFIISGRSISACSAKRCGMVDAVVPKRQLSRVARRFLQEQPKRKSLNIIQQIANKQFFRPWVARFFYHGLAKKVSRAHYPAPYGVVDQWVRDGAVGSKAMQHEASSAADLLMGQTSKNLVHVYFLRKRLKGLAKADRCELKQVHVIGAGAMGGDIAAWCALKGFHVTLQDQTPALIAPAMVRAHRLFKAHLQGPQHVQAAMDRLVPALGSAGIAKADIVIEAISEDLMAKQALYQTIEPLMKSGAILATNTSSIALSKLSIHLKNKTNFIGIHFFNPMDKMQLVEVVRGEKTTDRVMEQVLGFVGRIDRLPLPVKDSPGFLVNRTLLPYMMEALMLVDEGVPGASIDQVARDFGMPMGPIELADAVGLDICLSVAEYLAEYLHRPVPGVLRERVQRGDLGRKTGKGFYTYNKRGAVVKKPVPHAYRVPTDLLDCLIFRQLNEAVALLREQVVDDADLVDAGMIFGIGFAPFRGGPLGYARQRGVKAVLQTFAALEGKYGKDFRADKGWRAL